MKTLITQAAKNDIRECSDLVLIRTIDSHETILYQIDHGVKGYDQGRVEAELAEMKTEQTLRQLNLAHNNVSAVFRTLGMPMFSGGEK